MNAYIALIIGVLIGCAAVYAVYNIIGPSATPLVFTPDIARSYINGTTSGWGYT